MKNSKILNTIKSSKSVYQTKENRLAILSNSKIKPETIYLVKENFEPNDVGDLFAVKDDIVVVTKKKDPTGNIARWFVDNANSKGFLPARILESYNKNGAFSHSSSNNHSFYSSQQLAYGDWLTQNDNQTLSSSSNIYSEIEDHSLNNENQTDSLLKDFDPIKQKIYENTEKEEEGEDINLKRDEPPCNEYMIAAFEFNSMGEKQLSLKPGDIVIVKYKSDLHNNSEWWYVENKDNKCGYVPSNYLNDR